jgi:hypothetical protein
LTAAARNWRAIDARSIGSERMVTSLERRARTSPCGPPSRTDGLRARGNYT